MADYDVGYGKPPKRTRFKAGISGNLKGRPKRKPMALAEIVGKVLNAPHRISRSGPDQNRHTT